MGQYYKPISIEKNEHVYSHTYGNGLKLMEHSWKGNNFVRVVENLIAEGGAWHGDRIVWAGDYADPEEGSEENLFCMCENEVSPPETSIEYRYVVNLDTKEFVDKEKVPITEVYDDYPYVIHPLPLLTCEGNGRGGGDFHKGDPLVGQWARNRITVANEIPEGFKEVKFHVYEGERPVLA